MRNKRSNWLSFLGIVCLAMTMSLGGCSCGLRGSSHPGWDAMGIPNGKDIIPPPDGRAVLVLESFRLYPESKAGRACSWFVRGVVEEGVFHPDWPLKVEGKQPEVPDPRPVNWVPGWVEFAPLQRHLDMEAVSPRQPNLHGVFDPEGRFYPDALRM